MKVLSHLRQQCKKNNEGASLVTVLMITAIVMILVTVILSITLINYYMKQTNAKAQANFYDAESAMEEIRVGLSEDVSDVATVAYVHTLSNYSQLDDDGKTREFQEYYRQALKEKLWDMSGSQYYDLDHLTGFLRDTAYDEQMHTGAQLITPENSNYINETKDGLTLKNVKVSYTDGEGYATQIQTDFVLAYPPVDFVATSAMDNILCYALIAGESFEQKGVSSTICGNAYLGEQQSNVTAGNLTITNGGDGRGYVIGGGQLTLDSNSHITLHSMETWFQNLVLNNSSDYTMEDGYLYLQNDMVLGTKSKATLSGELYAYGDPDTALGAESLAGQTEAINQSPADYSSAIVVNGAGSGLDLSGLSTMYIAGHSYVQGSSSTDASSVGTKGSSNVKMGQSIAIKSDQRAYLVPAGVIGADCTNGATNPMTGKQYYALLQEIADKKYRGNVSKVTHQDVVDVDAIDKTLGVSMTSVGANDYKVCALATNGGGTMVYLFMVFDDDASANMFYRTYHRTAANYNRLMDNMDYYTTYGIKLPADIDKNANFYFDGNVIASDAKNIIVSDKLASVTADGEEAECTYQDYYAALNKKLTQNYDALTDEELSNNVFSNLINKKQIRDKVQYYVSTTGESAVVVKGDYTINHQNELNLHSVRDEEGNTHGDAKLHLVIATGDVTVTEDFEGLIVAGGQVVIKDGANLSADTTAVSIALMAANLDYTIDGEAITPAYYVKNAKSYLIGGISSADDDTGAVNLVELITYENWKKQ